MSATRQKQLSIYTQQNPGVVSPHDQVGLDCGCREGETRGIVYVARGGCVVMECHSCWKLWRFFGMQTSESGPAISATQNPNLYDPA